MEQILVYLGYLVLYCLGMWITVFLMMVFAGMFLGWEGGDGAIGWLIFAPLLPVIVPYIGLCMAYDKAKYEFQEWRESKKLK